LLAVLPPPSLRQHCSQWVKLCPHPYGWLHRRRLSVSQYRVVNCPMLCLNSAFSFDLWRRSTPIVVAKSTIMGARGRLSSFQSMAFYCLHFELKAASSRFHRKSCAACVVAGRFSFLWWTHRLRTLISQLNPRLSQGDCSSSEIKTTNTTWEDASVCKHQRFLLGR
jgi:hypothetical protein